MRLNSCRCVAVERDIAVAKVVSKREGTKLVCMYHRDEYEHLNLMAERGIGVLGSNDIVDIIKLENNTILL